MAGHNVTIESTIKALADERKYPALKDIFVTMNGADIAAVFKDIPEEKIPLLFRLLPKKLAAETFVEMSSDLQELLIEGFSNAELHEVIDELYVDDLAGLIDEMPANVVKRILAHADPEMRRDINEILKYPENSAGSIMTTEYISLKPNMTIDGGFAPYKRHRHRQRNRLHLLCNRKPKAHRRTFIKTTAFGQRRQRNNLGHNESQRHRRLHN
jgi:magnesium transporter